MMEHKTLRFENLIIVGELPAIERTKECNFEVFVSTTTPENIDDATEILWEELVFILWYPRQFLKRQPLPKLMSVTKCLPREKELGEKVGDITLYSDGSLIPTAQTTDFIVDAMLALKQFLKSNGISTSFVFL